jgi:outer membrane receptor protein involved in Fe transport
MDKARNPVLSLAIIIPLLSVIPLQAGETPTVSDYPSLNRPFSNYRMESASPGATTAAPMVEPTNEERNLQAAPGSKEPNASSQLAIQTVDPVAAGPAASENARAETSRAVKPVAAASTIQELNFDISKEVVPIPNSRSSISRGPIEGLNFDISKEVVPIPDNSPPITYPQDGFIKLVSGMFEMQQPVIPKPSPLLASATDRGGIEELFKSFETSNTQVVTGTETKETYSPSLPEAISQATNGGGVEVQRRSPVAMDPNVRGFKNNQIYAQANGAYWVPARRDLDTMLSKFDPGMIRYVTVLPGPYSVQYGPGLAFIDVEREPTPRHADGYRTDYELDGAVRTNGGQMYGRATAAGGGENWGFRASYGERDGSAYRSGNSTLIPTDYHNRDALGELSYDINPYQHVDFSYLRLDQSDTEYPCQFFDINYLTSYGFSTRIVDEDPKAPWQRLAIEGWYNQTVFQGDTAQKYLNPQFPTIQRINYALNQTFPGSTNQLHGATDGNAASSGARIVTTLGDKDDTYLNIGADFRYLGQFIREDFALDTTIQGLGPVFHFGDNMPHSWMLNPGAFVDWTKPLTENWTTTLGARIDSVVTRARFGDVRNPGASLPANPDDYTQSDALYAFYLNNQVKATEHITFSASAGLGQRAPSLLDRYADGLFISSAQSGFTRIYGDPFLEPERDWQIDLGMAADYDKFRSRLNVFQAWIVDYITYKDEFVFQFLDARRFKYINTNLGTLTGFDWFGEVDLYPRLSTFARMSYVQGQDQQIDQPLPAIPPLDSMIGLRLHSPEKMRRWEIELAARIVANQNRLGAVHSDFFPGGYATIEEATPGFSVWHISGYWNYTKNLKLVAGIDNIFNRNYQEHLDLRLSGPVGYPAGTTRVLSPGTTPYFGVNWVF